MSSRYYLPHNEDERKRIENYIKYEHLYYGRNEEVFGFKKEYNSQAVYIVNNFTRLIAEFFSDLLFSEPPVFFAQNQEALDEIIKETNLHTKNLQSSIANSFRGDVVYKLRRDKEDVVYIDDVPAPMYFPVFDPNDHTKRLEAAIAWVVEKDDRQYLRKEVHTPTEIRNEAYWIRKDGLERVDISAVDENAVERYENPVGEILVVHIPNYKISGSPFGISDIQGMESLLNEADFRMTQLASILDKHADPKLAVPAGVLDSRGQVASGNAQLFEVSASAGGINKPEYITWNAELEMVFKEIDLIAERLAMFGRMPMDFVQQRDKAAIPEAAKALKLKFLMSLKKAERKRVYYDAGLKETLRLAGLLKGVKLEDVTIEWNDGLPEDRLETLQIKLLEKQIGVKSQETVAREYLKRDGFTDEEVDEEVEKAVQENTDVNTPERPDITLPERVG